MNIAHGYPQAGSRPGEGSRPAGTPAARAGFGFGFGFARRIPRGRIAAATAAAGGTGV